MLLIYFNIFAQNSIKNNFTQKKIDRHIDYIDKKVTEYETQLNESYAAEDKANLKEKIELMTYSHYLNDHKTK
ncbi:hypothetical protein SDC9_86323 [bioreactor metagenome]|uniref:Uncharacterized protein n=1 Tax=bioreactor metagenome TaxID=1076179 RepID=A0A644ZFX6_9ZZZZ